MAHYKGVWLVVVMINQNNTSMQTIICFPAGSWLYLHNMNRLNLGVLQTTCNLLSLILKARQSQTSSLQWASCTIRVSQDSQCVCMAAVHATAVLPHTLLQSFKTCSMQHPQKKQFLEASLLAHDFESSAHLAKTLSMFSDGLNELFSPNDVTGDAKELPRGTQVSLHISHLKVVVSLAQQHMREFESLGVLQQQGALQIPSGVYSEFSGSNRGSLRFKPTFLQLEGGRAVAPARQSLEEFALVLALKDTLLSSLLPGSSGHSSFVRLLADTFPTCDVPGLLAYEKEMRENLAASSAEDSGAVESARESRAASAMQMVAEERLSEGMFICSDWHMYLHV